MTAATITTSSVAAYVDYRTDYASVSYETSHTARPGHHRHPAAHEQLRPALRGAGFCDHPRWGAGVLGDNPTGQYGFIEHATGAPLTVQLADLLTEAAP
ncbi:MAG: hypothetical protein M3460_03265 [Actinomycetota bacterium]|nr:hypothetical protein [Actinomycetota bacterium]